MSAVLGALLAAVGLLANRWALDGLAPPQSPFAANARSAALFVADFGLVFAGVWLYQKRPRLRGPLAAHVLAAAALFAAAGASGYRLAVKLRVVDPDARVRAAIEGMLGSEELILHLTPEAKRTLSRSAMNLRIPDDDSRRLFEDVVNVVDLAAGEPPATDRIAPAGVALGELPVDPAVRSIPRADLRIWQPMLDQLAYFSWAKLYFVKGSFLGGGSSTFDADMAFDALAHTRAGTWRSIRAKVAVRWRGHAGPDGGDGTPDWRIHAWKTLRVEVQDAARPLFREVTAAALAGDPPSLARARGSAHEELVLACLNDRGADPRCAHFTVPAIDRHPGVTVVDVDRDGLDDLYVMDELGKNALLHNRGDGTFEDIAPQLGLDLEGHASSAIFADFDNDGDLDVLIGRTLGRSLYLVNEGGRFVDRSAELVDAPLPFLVSSVSAADYDGDGLLDLYLSTYASALLERRRTELLDACAPGLLADFLEKPEATTAAHPEGLLGEFLPPADARELLRRVMTDPRQGIDNLHGPPNVLLHNVGGGRFVHVPGAAGLPVFRNTFQSTWGDYDGDGDPDLYCANDFGPPNLFRNDGGGRFTDVTAETGTAAVGFGMGASFGDYDNDGRQDLYTSDMFSKAGARITAQIPGLDPVFARMASGNTLFHNAGGRFERVSGLAPPALLVQKADWSYSSQLVDLDGDGWLDAYAPCGYYTAPPAIAVEVDI
jgi:hypothetical protein